MSKKIMYERAICEIELSGKKQTRFILNISLVKTFILIKMKKRKLKTFLSMKCLISSITVLFHQNCLADI